MNSGRVPQADVVDTLGAGDAFLGALGLASLEGKTVPGAARFAGAAASLVCTWFGGRLGCLRRTEVEALTAQRCTSGSPMADR